MSISLMIKITLSLAFLLGICLPFAYFFTGKKTKTRFKKSLRTNLIAVVAGIVISIVLAYQPSLAAENASNAANMATGLGYIAAALSTGLSSVGGGIAVARAASAALGAISEDGSIFGRSLIFVGLAEGIALYGLIISFMILGRL